MNLKKCSKNIFIVGTIKENVERKTHVFFLNFLFWWRNCVVIATMNLLHEDGPFLMVNALWIQSFKLFEIFALSSIDHTTLLDIRHVCINIFFHSDFALFQSILHLLCFCLDVFKVVCCRFVVWGIFMWKLINRQLWNNLVNILERTLNVLLCQCFQKRPAAAASVMVSF